MVLADWSALAKSRRADRVATAALEHLQTISALAAMHPEAFARWIRRLVYDAATGPPAASSAR